jgi:pyruvate/2-oxoacid:ferredoxin oxidoreductase alpha subunit
MKVKHTLKQVYPGIYLCTVEDMYDLAMTFCRVQEFYESPIKGIRGKRFTLIELMARYAKKNNGSFSYPLDWGGFNIPGPIIDNLYKEKIEDYNIYDDIIINIHRQAIKETGSTQYYLIGSNSDKSTIAHECAHALFFLDKEYKKKTKEILKKLHKSVYKKAEKVLLGLGYDKSVIDDELQAYLSTEFHSLRSKAKLNKRELNNLTDVVLAFKNLFKTYKEKIKI